MTPSLALSIIVIIGSLTLIVILIVHNYQMSGGYAAYKARRQYRRSRRTGSYFGELEP